MNSLFDRVIEELENRVSDAVEYGNLRKMPDWGERRGDTLVYRLEVDMILERPMVYMIRYDLDFDDFRCYSRMGGRSMISNLLQFEAGSREELAEKLTELAVNIPAMRERMIKEYIFSLFHREPRKRWRKFFKKDNPRAESLISIIREMKIQSKISENEAETLIAYVHEMN